MVVGNLTAATITEKLGSAGGSIIVKTLLDQEVSVTSTDSGLNIQSRGLEAPGALVLTADVTTCVGPVHVINAVLLPALPDGTFVDFGTEEVSEETPEVTGGNGVEVDTGSGETAAPEDPAVPGEGVGNSEGVGQVQRETTSGAASVSRCIAVLAAATASVCAVMA